MSAPEPNNPAMRQESFTSDNLVEGELLKGFRLNSVKD